MSFDRRTMLVATLGLGAAATAAQAAGDGVRKSSRAAEAAQVREQASALEPNSALDQSGPLQAALNAAAERGAPLILPAGRFKVSDIRLPAGARLIGTARATILEFAGGPAFITADKADGVRLSGLVLDGMYKAFEKDRGEGLVTLLRCQDAVIEDVEIRQSAISGLCLIECGGRVSDCSIHDVLDAGLHSLDATGLEIRGNTVGLCGNNGIQVWRSAPGEDGTIVAGNRVSRIRNASKGTGEYGNGVNVFRAGGVLVQGNRICDCTYTAVRGNAASNIQIIANSCERLGEVAIYAEFGFQGAVIANNIVDFAATGISVTNFNEGGRLAVVQGNLIRNLFRREQEAQDKRGEGITVEADAAVTGNTIEGAPAVGIQIGWGAFMRDVSATGNVVRKSKVGISVTSAREAGACLIANNLISECKDGAIRAMSFGAVSGPDLARQPVATGHLTVMGNVAV